MQQKTFTLLVKKKILYHLSSFDAVLTGTLPLDLFVPASSDLDITLQSTDFESVEKILLSEFSSEKEFKIEKKQFQQISTLICRFIAEEFPVEIFCQPVPVKQQLSYRHMIIEYWLLESHDQNFRKRIFELKNSGVKTEPAFAQVLGLKGDPYQELLSFEDDKNFRDYLKKSGATTL